MSNRELCVKLLCNVPDYKLGYVVAYLQGLTADEEMDDAFCMELYKSYMNDPERGQFVPFADALKECGVSQDEL